MIINDIAPIADPGGKGHDHHDSPPKCKIIAAHSDILIIMCNGNSSAKIELTPLLGNSLGGTGDVLQ